MLKFFFNKESPVLFIMEGLGIVCLIILIGSWWPSGKSWFEQAAFWLFIFEYLFIRFFSIVRCYNREGQKIFTPDIKRFFNIPKNERYEGIELQFKKAMVPTSYIIPVFGSLLLIGAPGFILCVADLLLTVIAHVNIILIYFHIKDKETLPVNFFTHNKHLR